MNVFGFAEKGAGKHGLLVQRVSAVAATLVDASRVALVDADDATATSSVHRTVALIRGVPAIARHGASRTVISYADPASESSMAMALAAMAGPGEPIAADPESLAVFALADRLAVSDIPVLINGPTGTGKEVLSRFIHARSKRSSGPFVAVNCAAMPEHMLEAMLFGHQKGAFTGATNASEGFMRAADGGTLLLDEIAELPLSLQAKLLRALQEQEVVPIGATKPIPVDIRVIACANRDLPTEVAEGRFRADLYYRLNVFPLSLRPLRERADDIAPLAFGMALRHAPNPARIPCFNEASLAMLKLHAWAGNVRELENVVRRALLLAGDAVTITPDHIVFDSPARLVNVVTSEPAEVEPAMNGSARKLSSVVQLSEARAIIDTLEACGGNRLRAARELGISERTLRYRLASFRDAGIEIGRAAAGGR
jgi:two-component system response regulator FlrC